MVITGKQIVNSLRGEKPQSWKSCLCWAGSGSVLNYTTRINHWKTVQTFSEVKSIMHILTFAKQGEGCRKSIAASWVCCIIGLEGPFWVIQAQTFHCSQARLYKSFKHLNPFCFLCGFFDAGLIHSKKVVGVSRIVRVSMLRGWKRISITWFFIDRNIK